MWKTLWMIGGALSAVLLLVGIPAAAEPEARVFPMEKILLLGGEPGSATVSPGGRYLPLGYTPFNEVKKYPALKSSRPLYGSIAFGQIPTDANSGIRFYFVIDASESTENKKAEDPGAVVEIGGAPGKSRPSPGTRNHDRLYFDANRDLDLTNDPVIRPMADRSNLAPSSSEVVFDILKVPVKEADGLGAGPLEVLPRLRLQGSARAYMSFSTATARKGTIELGGEKYTAMLTQPAVITGRYDTPYTSLILVPQNNSPSVFRGLMSQQYLSSMYWDAGDFFKISASPDGDRLTISPYGGDTGVLKVDAGDRKDAEKLGVSGILRSGETTLRFGEMSYLSTAEKLPKHNIPVGDYLPLSLSVDVGTLTASFSQNYYATEAPYARVAEPAAGVTIQKDKPFVLGFGGKPVVIFTAPGQGQVFKPGDTVSLRAMMIDPKLNLLIRGLSDTTQKLSEQTYRISGQTVTVPRYAPLVPTVTITNSSGEQVAEGTMPFG